MHQVIFAALLSCAAAGAPAPAALDSLLDPRVTSLLVDHVVSPGMGNDEELADDNSAGSGSPVGYFLRTFNQSRSNSTPTSIPVAEGAPLPSWMAGLTHFRLLPGSFPKGMGFHFDGLASVLKFEVARDGKSVSYQAKPFLSNAYTEYKKCLFYGTGTGPTLPHAPLFCYLNPGVNLLPIAGQLWLTIDTSSWGRVDPKTLDTIAGAKVNVSSFVLNAHPACDRGTGECFVQHPCPLKSTPLSKEVCFSLLLPAGADPTADPAATPTTTSTAARAAAPLDANMQTRILARATMPSNKIIQHSHSPCITPHYVVSKLDSFTARSPLNKNSGLLKFVRQGEDSLWFVMNRQTKETRLMRGDTNFVNNHFWNCYEEVTDASTGAVDVVVEAVAATEDYLDTYFQRNLALDHPNWSNIFHPALRCRIPSAGNNITCGPLMADSKTNTEDSATKGSAVEGSSMEGSVAGSAVELSAVEHSAVKVKRSAVNAASTPLVFDYPTFNPLFKMRGDYQFFYAIAAQSSTSRWFDMAVKIDPKAGTVVKSWSSPGIFMTEFDFAPAGNSTALADEDDGVLISVLYNSTSDSSLLGFFDAKEMKPIALYPIEGGVVPFHAHGIVCRLGEECFTNP